MRRRLEIRAAMIVVNGGVIVALNLALGLVLSPWPAWLIAAALWIPFGVWGEREYRRLVR